MFNKIKKPISFVLVFVMALTIAQITPQAARAASNQSVYCNVYISAPYAEYYGVYSGIDLDDYDDSSDLTDDFGLGLPTDGSDGFTAIRAIAKYVRLFVLEKQGVEYPAMATAEQKAAANAVMPKYIDYDKGLINGFSMDGENFDEGKTKEGVADPTGGWWSFYVNGDIPFKSDGVTGYGVNDYVVKPNDKIELVYLSTVSTDPFTTTKYGYFNKEYYGVAANKSVDITIMGDTFDWVSYTNQIDNIEDATISVCDSDGKTVATYKTDEHGQAKISKLTAGYYDLVATKDVKTSDGAATVSAITRATALLLVIPVPGKAKSVKAKASGKKIKVSWKNFSGYDSVFDYYQIYISKKKNSGYKRVANNVRAKSKTIKKSKGTYYIKIRAVTVRDVGSEANPEDCYAYGSYTKPVKVKVK